MSSSGPPVHSVHFYDSHESLISRLRGVVSSGLTIGNSVLIIATEQHRVQLLAALKDFVDLRSHARRGSFVMYDAQQFLSEFMVDGVPDSTRFTASVTNVLLDTRKASRSKDKAFTVFGEMVAVLWEQGNKAAAIALEQLWNNLLNESAFHLHCAYPRWLLNNDSVGMMDICGSHSHILGDRLQAA